jgi:predicted GIY-YIG superfamily endonuclease
MKLMQTIYKLRQVENKFYVGTTRNLELRLRQHQTGEGSMWTRKYKVIEVYEKKEVPEEFSSGEETKQTLQMMLKHGINNVRGAEYCLLRNYSINEIAFPMSHHLKMDYKEVQRELEAQSKVRQSLKRPLPTWDTDSEESISSPESTSIKKRKTT